MLPRSEKRESIGIAGSPVGTYLPREKENDREGKGGEKGVHRVSIKESATVEEGQEGADKGLPLFRAFDLVFFFVYRG